MQAYCFKCREKTEMRNPKEAVLKNGKHVLQGLCSVCSAKTFIVGWSKKRIKKQRCQESR